MPFDPLMNVLVAAARESLTVAQQLITAARTVALCAHKADASHTDSQHGMFVL
jgi:hypothetical protein